MATTTKTTRASGAAQEPAPAKTRARPAAKPAAKSATKPAAKGAAKAATAPVTAKVGKPVATAKAAKADKARKPKLVRDSFTIPKPEYAVLEELKQRAGRLGRPTKKSEVLRAGIMALAAMGDADFLGSVGAVPAVKTGRPAKA